MTSRTLLSVLVAMLLMSFAATDAMAMLNPTTGRFMQRDPAGYPDGMNRYGAYHVMNGGVDPSGLWVIERNGGAKATATSELGDTFHDLAVKVGLLPDEIQYWLSLNRYIFVFNSIGYTNDPADILPSHKPCPDTKVKVPNTIYAIWLLNNTERRFSRIDSQMRELTSEGFKVTLVSGRSPSVDPYPGPKASRVSQAQAYASLRQLSGSRELQGLFAEGHGAPTDFHDKNIGTYSNPRYQWRLYYNTIKWSINYKLGTVILNVCNGGWSDQDNPTRDRFNPWNIGHQINGAPYRPGPSRTISAGGRDLSSGFGEYVFLGLKEYLIPPFENFKIRRYFRGDWQGTR